MIKHLGVNVRQVDTTAQHELGAIVEDVEGGYGSSTRTIFPNGGAAETTTIYRSGSKRYQYVRADAAIAQYDACMRKAGESDAPFAVVKTTASLQVLCAGICEVSGVAADSYFWLTIHGYVPIANVADAASADEILSPSATAGRLATATFTTTAATLDQLNAGVRTAMSGILAVTDGNASNQAAVYIHGCG